jgi:hypothetical protein
MKFTDKRGFTITVALIAAILVGTAVFPAAGFGESDGIEAVAAEPVDYAAPLYAFLAEDADASIPANATRIEMTAAAVKVAGPGAAADDSTILIQSPGTYVLTGESTGRQILIDASKTDLVRVALDDASIYNEGAAAVYVKQAGKAVIILPEGTSNIIAGGVAESVDSDDDDDKSAQAAIFVKNDLVITGGGALTIEGPGRGAWAKDMLIMTGGTLDITTGGFALRGSDGVAMRGVTAAINAGGDGIKSTKADDPEKGFIQLEECALDITALNDAAQAESTLLVMGGTYAIRTGGGADAVALSSGKAGGGRAGFFQPVADTEEDAGSMKGLKAGVALSVQGGTFELDTQDDAAHSNGDVWITSGSFSIRTGDDAIHAEAMLRIDGGAVNIARCFEGLEGSAIEINGGEHNITASDDAVNLADGSASKGGWNMMGRGGSGVAAMTLYINGGSLRASGGADTIDANGNIVMNGGELYLSGMSQGMEGAIDFDGSFTINGGRLITAGSVLSVSAQSTQPALLLRYTRNVEAGSVIELRGESGEAILSLESETTCSVSGFSAPELSPGRTVSVWVNGEKRAEVTLGADAPVTSVSEDGGAYGSQFGNRGAFGGFSMPNQDTNRISGQTPAMPDGEIPVAGQTPPDGQIPQGGQRQQGGQRGGWPVQSPEPSVEPTVEPIVDPTVEQTVEPIVEPTVEPTI